MSITYDWKQGVLLSVIHNIVFDLTAFSTMCDPFIHKEPLCIIAIDTTTTAKESVSVSSITHS